jgi:hypothetical protein
VCMLGLSMLRASAVEVGDSSALGRVLIGGEPGGSPHAYVLATGRL